MKILFIQPNPTLTGKINPRYSFSDKFFNRLNMFAPSLSLQVLAAVTPKEHNIKMIDERYDKINFNIECDLVCISALTYEAPRAYEIADLFRKKSKKVIIGGVHASVCPKEAKEHTDCVVIGEADEIFPIVIKDFEKGCLKEYYQQEKPTDAEKIPSPLRDKSNRILLETGVQISRGCPFGCRYCYVGNLPWGKAYRKRKIIDVVKEIKSIRQKLIAIYAASMTIDLDYTRELFKELKKINKNFICLGNINILYQNDDLLRLSKDAGCVQWNIGFESISQKSLDEVNKKTNKVENYYKTIEKIHNLNMNVHGFFMFGFDNDSKNIFKDTLTFLKNSKIDSADFNILTPFPGTPLYDDYKKEGRILINNWSEYVYSKIVHKPKNLSIEDILNGLKTLYLEFYSYKAIAKRFVNSLKRGFNFSKLLIFFVRNIFMKVFVNYEIKDLNKYVQTMEICHPPL